MSIRILYIEDDPADAELTRTHFAASAPDFDMEIADTGTRGLEMLHQKSYDLLLLDHQLPDMTGIEVIRNVVQAGFTLPVIMVTASGDERLAVEALRNGASDYVPKSPGYLSHLPSVVRSSAARYAKTKKLGERIVPTKRQILYVEYNQKDIDLLRHHFSKAAPLFVVTNASTAAQALNLLTQRTDFDLVLTDLRLQDASGLELIRHSKHKGFGVPFVIVTGKGDEETAIAAMKLGAYDYIVKTHDYWNQLIVAIDNAILRHHMHQQNLRLQAEIEELNRSLEKKVEERTAELQNEIAERKKAEESVQRLLLAVEQTDEVIFMTNVDGTITYMNPAFEKVYGFKEREVVGKTPRILKSGTYDMEFYRGFWDTILNGKSCIGEIANKTKDGRLVTVESSVNPVLDAEGKMIGFIAVQKDITERKQLETRLIQSQKMETIGQLAGGVAHDFNNILMAMTGYCELLQMKLPPADPLQQYIKETLKAAEQGASLTRQLLAFSRKQVLSPKVLDLNLSLKKMDSMLRRLIGEDIELVHDLCENLGLVKSDSAQIEQVVLNLAVNARDAMPQGGKLTIETANEVLDDQYAAEHIGAVPGPNVMLAVSDNGCGMDQATLNHIFEPFFTTKEQGKGTGLGLSTVYGIVKQSGGYISAYSEVGKGTTFRIYFPRVDAPVEAPAVEALKTELLGGSEAILLVDDNDSVRSAVAVLLEMHGYRVLQAGNGQEALEAARQHNGLIHLLITDVVMPVMNGRELAQRIEQERSQIKVLYMSGYTDEAVHRHGILEPGDSFLQKPASMEALLRKIRELLDAK